MSRPHEIWDVNGQTDQLCREWGEPWKQIGRHWELLKATAELVRGKRVLDAGCGMGHFYSVLLKEKPGIDYCGFDNSENMLGKARKAFPDESHRFEKGDVYDIKSLPMFDTVVNIDVLLHLPEIETPVRQLWSKAEKELIVVTRTDPKGFYFERPFSGKIVLPDSKHLIIRAETVSNLLKVFGVLEELGTVEIFYYDPRSTIFRLTRGVPRYGSFRSGWVIGEG